MKLLYKWDKYDGLDGSDKMSSGITKTIGSFMEYGQ